jgi:ribonuclease HII
MLQNQLDFLRQLGCADLVWIAGVDEVGRGALFGPVVAAAVIVSQSKLDVLSDLGVTDSKGLTPVDRERLMSIIKATVEDCQIGLSSVREIDQLNILQATLLAMRRAIKRLQPQPQLCLIDGNQRIPDLLIPQVTVIKGDQKSVAIAAASIVAKAWRDRLIVRMAAKYPDYDLTANKGYGTVKHRAALQTFGPSRYHRQSFRPCQLK